MKILFPCRLLSGWCAIPDREAWKISRPKRAGGLDQGVRGRLGCTAPALVAPASPEHVYLLVGLPGLRLESWTAALPYTPFPPNPSCLQVPSPRALSPSFLAPSCAPWGMGGGGGIGPVPGLFPGLRGLDCAALPASRLGVTCWPGGTGAGTAVASPLTCAPEAGLSPGTSKSPHLLAAASGGGGGGEWRRPYSLLSSAPQTAAPWGLQFPGATINKEQRI